MKTSTTFAALTILAISSLATQAQLRTGSADGKPLNNPQVDMAGFMIDAQASAVSRMGRVIDQKTFLAMSAEQGTIVLDARSADKFALLHVKGSQNLPFTDFTKDSLAKLIADPATRILIYCNNNFDNAPAAMPAKSIRAALNLSTLISLRSYGYLNVYELGGYIDVNQSELPLAGTSAPKRPIK